MFVRRCLAHNYPCDGNKSIYINTVRSTQRVIIIATGFVNKNLVINLYKLQFNAESNASVGNVPNSLNTAAEAQMCIRDSAHTYTERERERERESERG